MNVAGTHEGHLTAFIDYLDDDYTNLTPDTRLIMTFLDEETDKGAEGNKQASDSGNLGEEKEAATPEGAPDTEGEEKPKVSESSTSDTKASEHSSTTEAKPVDSGEHAATESVGPVNSTGIVDSSTCTAVKSPQDLYHLDFPHGAILMKTPTDGLLCGLHAIAMSWAAQHPNLQAPTVQELQTIVDSLPFELLMAPYNLHENKNNFYAEQLMHILDMWASDVHGTHIQLGIVDGVMENPRVHDTGHPQAELRVWIHHQADPEHWSALLKFTEEDEQIVKGALEPDETSNDQVAPSIG